jgi:transcriptional antiterminator NusG
MNEDPQSPTPEPAVAEASSKLPCQWYALHVLSGQEENVRTYMTNRMKSDEMEDYVEEIVIPTERVSEVKRGKKIEAERRLYPGYVFIHIHLLDDEKKVIDKSWYFIRDTPGVIGFADGEQPIPMRQKEVDAMLAQMKEKEDKVVPKIQMTINDRVRVGDGPFEGQEGLIEEIDEERGRLRVAVTIFGRSTPVDLEFWQVEKL